MGKIFGILLVVVGIWLGLEVYLNGMEGAFGGALASFGESADEQAVRDTRSVPRRAGDAVQRAHGDAEERLNRMLGE